ncbi:MAG: energy-coupling factor transporter transmembrane component T [Propionibacterium sp.]
MKLENYLGVYRAGNSLMHRSPIWLKYLLLLALGVLPFFVRQIVLSLCCLVLAALVLWLAAGLPLRTLNPGLAIVVMNLLVLGYYAVFWNWQTGVVFVAGMLSCLWLARMLTSTSPASQIMDAVASLAKPFRRFGAKPETFALTIAIMWNSIPYLLVSVRTVREAARARGLERVSWRFAAPVVVSAVGHALQVGEALQARGLGD